MPLSQAAQDLLNARLHDVLDRTGTAPDYLKDEDALAPVRDAIVARGWTIIFRARLLHAERITTIVEPARPGRASYTYPYREQREMSLDHGYQEIEGGPVERIASDTEATALLLLALHAKDR